MNAESKDKNNVPSMDELKRHEKTVPTVEEPRIRQTGFPRGIPTGRSEGDEFSLPTELIFDEKFNVPVTDDAPKKLHTTYCPRFTDVTDRKQTENRQEQAAVEVTEIPAEKYVPGQTEEREDFTLPGSVIVPVGRKAASPEGTVVIKPSPENVPEKEENIGLAPEEAEIIRLLGADPETSEDETEDGSRNADFRKTVPDPVDSSPEKTAKMWEATEIFDPPSDIPIRETESPKIPTQPRKKNGTNEFTSLFQRVGFRDSYLDQLTSVKIRFAVAAVLTLAGLFFENVKFLIPDFPWSFQPVGKRWIEGNCLTVLLFLALPEVFFAVRSLFRREIRFELTVPLSYLIGMGALLCSLRTEEIPSAVFPFGIAVLCAIASEHCRLRAEYISFCLIANDTKKRVIECRRTRTLEAENMALDGAIDEYRSVTARASEIGFVPGFRERVKRRSYDAKNEIPALLFPLGLSVLVGAVAVIGTGTWIGGMNGFLLSWFLSFPAAGLLTATVPMLFQTKRAKKKKSAVIGEASYDEYAAADVIVFEDTEVFGSSDVALKRMLFYGEKGNLSKTLRRMSSLFGVYGGPLDVLFAKALDRKSPPATNAFRETDGIVGTVDGVTVCAGTADYMKRNGIGIPEEDDRNAGIPGLRVMFAAENGKTVAKFLLRYALSDSFMKWLPTFRKEGIVPLVRSGDPNVCNELMRSLTRGEDRIRVLKRTEIRDEEKPESVGLVTKGNKETLLRLLMEVRQFVRFRSRANAVRMSLSVVGSLIAVPAVILIGTAIPTALIGAWQGIPLAALLILSGTVFKAK